MSARGLPGRGVDGFHDRTRDLESATIGAVSPVEPVLTGPLSAFNRSVLWSVRRDSASDTVDRDGTTEGQKCNSWWVVTGGYRRVPSSGRRYERIV